MARVNPSSEDEDVEEEEEGSVDINSKEFVVRRFMSVNKYENHYVLYHVPQVSRVRML